MGSCVYRDLIVYFVTLGLMDHTCDLVRLFLEMLRVTGELK